MDPRASFDEWRSTVQQIHDLEPDSSSDGFVADVTAWSLGPLVVAGGFFTGRRMVRDERVARRLQLDHYRILLPLGATRLQHSTGDARSIISAGQMVFSDLSRAEEADCGSGELMQFIIGREVLDEMLPGAPAIHGLVPGGPMGALLTDHLTALVRHLDGLSAAEAQSLVVPTLQLVAAFLRPTTETLAEARPAVQTAQRRRILHFIEAELLNPSLTQDAICARFGLSRASLYRLFQPMGGVAAHVHERRLRRLHAELAGPGSHHLGQLSYTYGFSSQAQMSRAFRALFGHAPRDTVPACRCRFVRSAARMRCHSARSCAGWRVRQGCRCPESRAWPEGKAARSPPPSKGIHLSRPASHLPRARARW